MSWLKQSDIAADHPLVMRLLEYPKYDDRLLNEMYGWVNRCATKSAAHDMDYIVGIGQARSMAFGRYEELKAAALFCGIFFERVIVEDVLDDKGNVVGTQERDVLKLVEEKDLFHMILRSEKEWEAQRQYDNRNPERTGPVRRRDGDECRWCGRITRWDSDRRSPRMGTIDHLKPGLKECSEDDLVVACKSCNSARQEGDNWTKKLRPVPEEPYYSEATATWLIEKCGFRVTATEQRTKTKSPAKLPAGEKQKAVEPPKRVEDPAKVAATDIPGATVASSPATEQAEQDARSHSDLLAFPSAESYEDDLSADGQTLKDPEPGQATVISGRQGERSNQSSDHAAEEAVEPPKRVEDPARSAELAAAGPAEAPVRGETEDVQESTDPEPRQATVISGHQGERLNHDQDQTPIKTRPNHDQNQTTGASYVRSGFAGSGRDGMGRAGSGGAGHAGSNPSGGSRRSRRRNRPRNRKGKS